MSALSGTELHAGGAPRDAAPHVGETIVATLERLGARQVFGLPGVHALSVWDALRRSSLPALVLRTEVSAAFAAQAYAQATRTPAVLVLSSGPGSLMSLAGVMEAASSHVPLLVIAAQVPRDVAGRRRGYLHDLHDQAASFVPVAKDTIEVSSPEAVAGALTRAWATALEAPCGPVYVGVPYDVLLSSAPQGGHVAARPPAPTPAPDAEDLAAAIELLDGAQRPLLWAGGGVLRAGASGALRALAERLDAPVATTYMGKGALSEEHPLAVGSGCEQSAYRELVAGADVVLAVGTELGSETTAGYELRPGERLIHVDVAPERIGTTFPALGVVGDAGDVLAALAERVQGGVARNGAVRAAAVRERIAAGIAGEEHALGRGLVAALERAVPDDVVQIWDSTILAYWAMEFQRVRTPGNCLYPLGSGTIGYAISAGIGVAAGGQRALTVCGDGGAAYGLADLATAVQHDLDATFLIVDDGGYGILRHYQLERYGVETNVVLGQPDFAALAASFGAPVTSCDPAGFEQALAGAIGRRGPHVVVLSATISAPPRTL
jgi:acetolactate synthase-1/2/3 large subunit